MTVCIAAQCAFEGRPAIVVCADVQGTYAGMKSNDLQKVQIIARTPFTYMFADEPTKAKELAAALEPILREYKPDPDDDVDFDLRSDALLQQIKKVVAARKRANIDDFLLRKYGFTRDDFYSGKLSMSDLERSHIAVEIADVSLGCSMLLVSPDDAEPIIFKIGGNGEAYWSGEPYAAIGSGGDIARAVLSKSAGTAPWASDMSVMECAIRVLTAKEFAEQDIHVSSKCNLGVVLPNAAPIGFSPQGVDYINQRTTKIRTLTGIETSDDFFYAEDISDVRRRREKKPKPPAAS